MFGFGTTATPMFPILPPLPGRPHPHINGTWLFLSHIPSHVSQTEVTQELGKYGPFRWDSHGWLPECQRLKPNIFYNNMTYNMDVEFPTRAMMEKVLVCFPTSPLATVNGIVTGLFSNSAEIPPLNSEVAARYITPVTPVGSGQEVPSTQDIYELVRWGGSVRLINVVRTCSQWTCRVEWWYEDESQKFQYDFKLAGSKLKDWTVAIFRETDPKYAIPFHLYPPQFTPPLPYMPLSPFPPHLPPPPFAYHMPEHYTSAFPQAGSVSGMRPRALSTETPRPLPPVPPQAAVSAPMRPKPLPEVFSPSPKVTRPPSNWQEIKGELPSGEIGVIGLGDQYGNRLLHKPGQHTVWRDGSQRSSGKPGWVDLCNLRVKGLDADINDTYLKSIFEKFEGLKSSAVSRESRGNPKTVGFVSFNTIEQTKTAMDAMQGQKCGSKTLEIRYHEPTKLKPEKTSAKAPS